MWKNPDAYPLGNVEEFFETRTKLAAFSASSYRKSNNSTSKVNVAFGGITPPAPRAP